MDFSLSARQKRVAGVAAVVVVVVALASVAVVALELGPLDESTGGDGGGGATATPPSTGTVYTDAPGGGSATEAPFSFNIQTIEKCGQTCRDVTVTLRNNQNETATGVSVYTRIYAGNNTEEKNKIWTGQRDIGELEAESSVTRTSRVELSMQEGFKVQQKDGWITIVTTVKSDQTTITFKSRRDVA